MAVALVAAALVGAAAAVAAETPWGVYCYTEKKWLTAGEEESRARDLLARHKAEHITHVTAARACNQYSRNCSQVM